VWIEKEALIGVINQICRDEDVPYFACKGYVSQSELWKAAQRIIEYENDYAQNTYIIHLGDHDPSGIDMSRDIQERLDMFGAHAGVKRIALNFDQIEKYNPPPNPTKLTDTRAKDYIQKYGESSWELDALDPKTLRDLIRNEVNLHRDPDVYADRLKEEFDHKSILNKVAKNWKSL
jgi:alkaline phosphatase